MPILRTVKAAVRRIGSPLHEVWERQRRARLYVPSHTQLDPSSHLREAAAWLCRAQDHGSDRGVSYGTEFGKGFMVSYPETTGYIIRTFLDLARHFGDEAYLERAVAMGHWEVDIQMKSGAVMGGPYNTDPTPAVFDTGMVLLGWSSLYRATGIESFRTAGVRAGQWLLDMQEPNGHWVRGNNALYANPDSTVYNVKAAWGLAEMGVATQDRTFVDAAVRNAEYTLTRQRPNGWFEDCCLEDKERPLLHTIAYTMQGLIGIGRLTGRQDFIDGAARTSESLMRLMTEDGFIPGKIDCNFRGASGWCCLTGTAQTAIVWSQLGALTGRPQFRQAAERANRYLMARHDISNADLSIRGGLAGSWNVWGDYGRFKVLNWATKFLADALLEHYWGVDHAATVAVEA